MAGTLNINQIIPDQGQDLYLNTGQYGANLVVGNATTQLLVVSPQGILSSGGTSALGVPAGTTAQRPANPVVGYIRFNTDTQLLENYTANGWIKVSVNVPTITSISGTIYSGNTSTLTINGTNFGAGFTGTVIYTAGANTATASATPTSELLVTTTVPATVYGWASGTVVSVSYTNSGGGVSPAYNMTIVGLPTGGTITNSGNTRIHSFTSSSTLTVPTGFSATASYLVVAGGGSGGCAAGNQSATAGGGGAGGLLSGTTSLSAGSYTITVGSGGAGGTSGTTGYFNIGANTTAFLLTANGGGMGDNADVITPAKSGGSGGGGSYAKSAGSGTPGQGNPGGTPGGPFNYASGGGGGAGASGSNGSPSASGNGGVGLSSSITGSPVYYAGGGGGGGGNGTSKGTGGSGGGTDGGNASPVGSTSSSNATSNSGGGSGASGAGYGNPVSVGNGGSGIVIVSYNIP